MAKWVTLGDLISPAPLVRCGSNEYPILSMTMHDGIVLQSERFKKSLASLDQSSYKVVDRGQLVVGFPIDEGVLYVQNAADAGIMSPAYNVWNIDSDKIFSRFLELSLHSSMAMQYYKDNLRGTTARRRSLPTEVLLALPVLLPSMEEQVHMAMRLDKLNGLISLRKQQLAKLDELVKARFVEMFGDVKTNPNNWPIEAIGNILKSCESGWSGNGTQRKRQVGEIAVLKVSSVTKGYFVPEECKVLDNQTEIKKYVTPEKGDLLFSRANTRELVGATALIMEDYPELILPDKLWKIRLLDDANVFYMKYVLSSNTIRAKFSAASTGTSGSMYNVSMDKFKSIAIPLPPLKLQEQFADFVKKLDKSKLTIQRGLDKLEVLKKSLMKEYFG